MDKLLLRIFLQNKLINYLKPKFPLFEHLFKHKNLHSYWVLFSLIRIKYKKRENIHGCHLFFREWLLREMHPGNSLLVCIYTGSFYILLKLLKFVLWSLTLISSLLVYSSLCNENSWEILKNRVKFRRLKILSTFVL